MTRQPPGSTLTATLFPYTTLFRSPRAVKFVGAGFERRDHLPERLVEHLPGERLEHATAEREIDHEVDAAAAVLEGMEMPFVAQMLHRAVDIADDDLVRPLLVDAARKALAQPLEADAHVGDGFMLAVEIGRASGRASVGRYL